MGQRGDVKKRAGGERALAVSAVALRHRTGSNLAGFVAAAPGALEAGRPAPHNQSGLALGLIAERFEEGRQTHARPGLHHFRYHISHLGQRSAAHDTGGRLDGLDARVLIKIKEIRCHLRRNSR